MSQDMRCDMIITGRWGNMSLSMHAQMLPNAGKVIKRRFKI